jgi:hypothetical protein
MTPRWFRTARLAWERGQTRQRITRYFDCTWQSAWGVQRSRVSSLSPTGCYIESRSLVPKQGELVQELTVDLPSGHVNLQGTVIEAMPGVGFAVRFASVDMATRECLTAFVKSYSAMTSQQ